MAQKKKVPARSQAKSKPKAHAAASGKPAKKTSESKAVKSKKSVKAAAKLVAKGKLAVKAAAPSKPVGKPVAKPAAKVAPKVVEKKAGAPMPKAVKPEVKPAAAPAPGRPVASATPPATGGKQPQPAPAGRPGAKPGTPDVAKSAHPLPGKPPAAFGGANASRSVPTSAGKPAIRTFPAPTASPRDIALKTLDARHQQMASALAAAKKPVTQRHGFKINEFIVYPAHGVGRIVGIEEQEIAGMSLELFVIQFEKDKMTLRVPTGKLQSVGMRKLAEEDIVTRAMDTLKGRARVKRTMWSRRAQEYEAKINSGDLVSIAEVVRDLYRSESQPEQSYSERQLYEAALDRMAREIAAVARIDERGAVQRITEVLAKSAKGRRAAEAAGSEVGADAKAA